MNNFKFAERLNKLPPYLFDEIDRMKRQIKSEGVDIIDLGIGDPDLPTPSFIIKKLQETAADPAHHRYPSYSGLLQFRQAVAQWYKKRFKVELNPEEEVISLIGSKEGIAHIPLAFVNPGEAVLVPSPGYPVYQASTIFAGGEPVEMPLLEKNSFLPDLANLDKKKVSQTKLMFLNYPNNPTAAAADKRFFERVVDFARENKILVCHDAAYSELVYDGYTAPSFLEAEGSKEVGVEFHSLSKTFNMTGWRIGFVVGNQEIIKGLRSLKTNIDSGVFQAIQMAAIEALGDNSEFLNERIKIYEERRNILFEGLSSIGWEVKKPQATFYIWAKIPEGSGSSLEVAKKLLKGKGIVATPGIGFGRFGEGYLRFALTVSKERIKEAVTRLKSTD